MKSVNHKAIKINFDTANIYHYNQLPLSGGITEMEKVIPYIGSFHLKQTNGRYKDGYFPTFNDPKGIVDFKKIFSIMDSNGFDGIYTLEIEGTGQEGKLTVDQAKKRVTDSINHLKMLNLM
jgi:sugar phosphate isomerase/epimerase